MESQSERDVQARVCRLDDQFHDDRGPLPRCHTHKPVFAEHLYGWRMVTHGPKCGRQFGQRPAAHSCLAEVERYDGPPVIVTAFNPPEIVKRDGRDSNPRHADYDKLMEIVSRP